MRRTTTWGVIGAVALATTFGVSLPPRSKQEGGQSPTRGQANGKPGRRENSEKSETDNERACDDLVEALHVFLAIEEVPRPDSCLRNRETNGSPNPNGRLPSERKKNAAAQGNKSSLGLKFVVATLPDPIHTHLALMFDRMAEVIQDAAQDGHYSYESSWLPWDDKEQTFTHQADQDQADNRRDLREKQPGIFLFRKNAKQTESQDAEASAKGFENSAPPANATVRTMHPGDTGDAASLPYREGLVIFVVGEDPTRGIHVEQFQNALAWIEKLGQQDPKAPARTAILGPVFSGSFPSLAKLLSETSNKALRARDATDLAIYSGTANSGPAIEAFESLTQSDPRFHNLSVNFQSFLERDELGLERFCKYAGKLNVPPESIAIISEDETAFGADRAPRNRSRSDGSHSETACLSAGLWLYYPRDLSSLRAAYQSNSIFNTNAPQQSSDTVRVQLPTNLADPEGEDHDSIRSYAGNQTPLSQEAYLLGLVNVMRVHHSQFIVLRSTNPLDQLFLARYLRRAYPGARIVTDGADRLFERDRSVTGMGGTMSVSTYPLLEREREWIYGKAFPGGHRSFNSDTSEGTYIAFRLLLESKGLCDSFSEPCIQLPKQTPGGNSSLTRSSLTALPWNADLSNNLPRGDYGMPIWMIDRDCRQDCDAYYRPATWLSVLGRDGYWAIAAINEKTVRIETESKRKCKTEADNAAEPDQPSTDNRNLADTPLSLNILMIFLAAFVVFHLWCCGRASLTAKPAFRTHFANPGERRHTVLVFMGSCFLAVIPLLVAWGCGLFDGNSAMLIHPWGVSMVLLIECLTALAASATNILRVEKLESHDLGGAPKRSDSHIAITIVCVGSAIAVFMFFVFFAWPVQEVLELGNRLFTYYRNIHILSGVSPIAPLMALAVGMYLWFWHSLHGLALFGPDRCVLPAETDLEISDQADNKEIVRVLRMFSQERAAIATENDAKPLSSSAKLGRPHQLSFLKTGFPWMVLLLTVFATMFVIVWKLSDGSPIRTLGVEYYSVVFLLSVLACFSLLIVDAWQFLRTWSKLRELLMFLDRLPLRRTLAALRGFSWGSVWGMSGNVLDVRYKLLSRQLESVGHTLSILQEKAVDNARCCVAARSLIAVSAGLNEKSGQERDALANECLQVFRELRNSTTEILKQNLDTASGCIVAQKLRISITDPTAATGLQECISALENFIKLNVEPVVEGEQSCIVSLQDTRDAGRKFAIWYADHYGDSEATDVESLKIFQVSVAKTAATLLTKMLLPSWKEEGQSLVLEEGKQGKGAQDDQMDPPPLSEKAHIRNAEEFVCLPYLGFVQNILGRMRSMVMGMVSLFVAVTIAIASYPFDPREILTGAMLALFIVLAVIIFYVYAQMHRDATLSHVTNTKPGELGGEFWFKVLGYGFAPLLGLLATIFPEVADFVFSWLQPGLQSFK